MGYIVRTLCFSCALVWAILAVTPVSAQTQTTTPTWTPEVSPSSTTTPSVSVTPPSTATADIPASVGDTTLEPTPTPTALAAQPAQPTGTPAASDAPLQGTIIANRSQDTARFFVEGGTFELAAGRSQGISLVRSSTVLSLFNCPAETPESDAGCFWDPYLIQRDGFYELYSSSAATSTNKILLREAGVPPTTQVWVQNRTGNTESVVFRGDVHEMPPTSVLEFPVATGVPAILYIRNCLALDGQQVCEWAPRTLDAGVYYAMVEVNTPGSQPGASVITIDLRPVVAGEEVALESAATVTSTGPAASPIAAPVGVVCTLAVPTLNIRSGPGLQYEIIGKIRTITEEPTKVTVTGRSADGLWLTVEPALADQGWITADPSFVACSGTGDLPIVEAAPASAAPTPQPTVVAVAPASSVPGPTPEGAAPDAVEPTPTPAPEPALQVPAGYAQLLVNNGFQHEMRFTIDQIFRPFDGPSEYDIQSGEGVAIIVFPGQIAFTASSPWNGLSQNADLTVSADQSIQLWLRFELDGGGSWVLLWE